MNNRFLLPPPSQIFHPHSEEAGAGGGTSGKLTTRRAFLKRTGGATVAAAAAWHLTTGKSYAEEAGGGSWKMECVDPSALDNPVTITVPVVIPQPIPYADITTTVKVVATSGLTASPTRYTSVDFIGTGSVTVGAGTPSLFVNSYHVECDAATGAISSGVQLTPSNVKKVTIGQVEVSYIAMREGIYPGGASGGASMRTAVRGRLAFTVNGFSYTIDIPDAESDPVYVWTIFVPVQD